MSLRLLHLIFVRLCGWLILLSRSSACVYYHTEAARLSGATGEEINEAALMAKHTKG